MSSPIPLSNDVVIRGSLSAGTTTPPASSGRPITRSPKAITKGSAADLEMILKHERGQPDANAMVVERAVMEEVGGPLDPDKVANIIPPGG